MNKINGNTMCFSGIPLILALLSCGADGYRHFRSKIPNGHNVTNPCDPESPWVGVGHQNPLGGGARNPFGLDFMAHGLWTTALCRLDSDGDGRTNGEELGDPGCTWREGVRAASATVSKMNITHPGICEPWNSDKCAKRNEWLGKDCNAKFSCPSIQTSDAINVTLRMKKTAVPAVSATSLCSIYDMPHDTGFPPLDIIAGVPVVGEERLLYSILLYSCNESKQQIATTDEPFPCGMGTSKRGCETLVGVWGLGTPGFCLNDSTGIRFGDNLFKKVLLEVYLYNPTSQTGLFDDSGITLFYTGRTRPHTSGTLMIGQQYLQIPPTGKTVHFHGGCDGECTSMEMKGPVYITMAFTHMHYLGYHASISIVRNRTTVHTLIDEDFEFETPRFHTVTPAVEVTPGDEILVTCKYKSARKETVYWGMDKEDEMCYGFLRYFPGENLHIYTEAGCSSWKSLPLCKLYTNKTYVVDGCNRNEFVYNPKDPVRKELFDSVIKNCPTSGACLPGCYESRDRAMVHPCLAGDMGDFVRTQELEKGRVADGMAFLKSLAVKCKTFHTEKQSGASPLVARTAIVALVACLMFIF